MKIVHLNYYNTIAFPTHAEHKERGSKFLAYAFPLIGLPDFKKRLLELKEEHSKATHHCFAYRIGLSGDQFRANDDGEPAGTAGKPILGQIDSRALTNIAVVVVRYFGGILLGVPGLITAYKNASSLALQLTPLIQKPVLIPYELLFDYTLINDVMTVVKKLGCTIMQQELQLFCRMVIGIPREMLDAGLSTLHDLHRVQVKKIKVAA